jgi:hypothetical protein
MFPYCADAATAAATAATTAAFAAEEAAEKLGVGEGRAVQVDPMMTPG